MMVHWCEQHCESAWSPDECWKQVYGEPADDQYVPHDSPCKIVERILIDPEHLPEHAVEAAARVLSMEMCGIDELDDPGCMAQHRDEARAAIRGFLESLSEEDK